MGLGRAGRVPANSAGAAGSAGRSTSAFKRHGSSDLAGNLPVDRPRGREHPHELGEVDAAGTEAGKPRKSGTAGKPGESGERLFRTVRVPLLIVVALSGMHHAASLWTCPPSPSREPPG